MCCSTVSTHQSYKRPAQPRQQCCGHAQAATNEAEECVTSSSPHDKPPCAVALVLRGPWNTITLRCPHHKSTPHSMEGPNPSKPTTGPLQPQQQEVPHGLQMLRMEHNRVAPGTPTPRHHPWVSQKRTSPASGHTPHAPSCASWKVSHGSCQLPPYFFLPMGSLPKGRVRREAIGRRLKLSWPSTKLGV